MTVCQWLLTSSQRVAYLESYVRKAGYAYQRHADATQTLDRHSLSKEHVTSGKDYDRLTVPNHCSISIYKMIRASYSMDQCLASLSCHATTKDFSFGFCRGLVNERTQACT